MGRELVGWFLTRDLQLDWRMGAEFFESALVDYEPAANWFNWVYRCVSVAGTNKKPGKLATAEIVLWGPQHDPQAKYVLRWLPELRPLAQIGRDKYSISAIRPLGGPLIALEPWRLRMQTQQSDLVIAARSLEQRGDFAYGKDYPLPLIEPLFGVGKFDTLKIARHAFEAQEQQKKAKAKLRKQAETKRLKLQQS